MEIVFWLSGILIFFGMIGYPASLIILDKIYKDKKNVKNYDYIPNVTLLIVAHNEEKVIKQKLENVIKIDYPNDKLEILISSDNSSDRTNNIVKQFIRDNGNYNIKLYEVKERKGKTNAQNEAVRIATGEIIVMTDANAMLHRLAVRELVASFTDKDIAYVTGQLIYINDEEWTSKSEATYWDFDLKMREVESRIQTITAGNGALYACRADEYVEFNPIECHDSIMPIYYALEGKRAISNHDAKAFEKAGQTEGDEFSRKVRMARKLLSRILPSIKILNIYKYRWFTYFYLGHRTTRYLLGPLHILLYIANGCILKSGWFYQLCFIGQTFFYIGALIKMVFKVDNKFLNMMYYYCLTLVAQLKGMYNQLAGKSKPFWEKAESTR